MADFADWIGREEERTDIACPHRVAGLMALLDKSGPLPDTLPPLGHWLLAPPIARHSDLDIDGHPRRGGDAMLPPIALPRRMWAGSEVEFLADVPLGAAVIRRTRVAAVQPKTGRSGAMVFVTFDHDIRCDGTSAIRERQHIVYREAAPAAQPARIASVQNTPAVDADATATYTADPVALFRYSALTFNGHRIHYDRDHAVTEGYPGLVVHGPFLATLLLEHARRHSPGANVRRFAFRARAPVLDGSPFTLAMDGDRLWIVESGGKTAMTGEVGWA